ncbi:hypothetical protein AMS59_03500 [Lysinibacillus sp. FJAT-14745]|uniref:hypothetical protein n=1 Tax=Lysinibacillus sp. FJAT-14745 TaxID=1704289 RepID=UPI0006ABDE06|nr:hypothetical protein [Lysinibacillus sp. FJAT-14745]KOP80464.1 hypothetical protein AMS59_03500 [Lysinibacillus sp. FJAT-14745]
MKINNEKVEKAIATWEELSLSQEEVIAYLSRLKYILDEAAKLEDVKYMVEQKGVEKGREIVKEDVANKLLANGMDIDFIRKITGLSTERIEEIKEKLNQSHEDK